MQYSLVTEVPRLIWCSNWHENISWTLWQSHCFQSTVGMLGTVFVSDHHSAEVPKRSNYCTPWFKQVQFYLYIFMLLDEPHWFSGKTVTKTNEVYSFPYPVTVLAVFVFYVFPFEVEGCQHFLIRWRTRVPGIKYVVDRHPTMCGLVCTDVGRYSKTVPFDCLHLLWHFFSGWNLCFCFL